VNFQFQSLLLPLTVVIVGGIVLALLHLLKVQPPRRIVATTMFWMQSTREQHRRVLLGRFSRWRSFLLLLLIVLLLGAALTGMRWPSERRGEPVVMVLDAGFSMAARSGERSRLQEAIARVSADLLQLGNRPVAVVVAADQPQLLVGFGQPTAIIEPILQHVRTSATPACSDRALRLAAGLLPSQRGSILWYTDKPDGSDQVPQSVRSRVLRRGVGSTLFNSAILSASVETADEPAMRCRLRIRVGTWGGSAQPLRVRIIRADTFASQEAAATFSEQNVGDAVFDDLACDGAAYQVTLLDGGAAPEDDQAVVRLPRRVPLAFRVDPAAPAALKQAAAAIETAPTSPAHVLIDISTDVAPSPPDTGGSIVVVTGDDEVPAGTPAQLDVASPLASGLTLESAACGAGPGLHELGADAMSLIRAGGQVVAAFSSQQHRLLLSSAMFSAGSTIPHRPGFFLLLMRACRQMAGWSPSSLAVPLERRCTDPLWPPSGDGPGELTTVTGSRVASDLTVAAGLADPLALEHGQADSFLEPWQLALALAGGLLLVEGLLQIKGRVV
jgi:hypothetical protein